MGIGDSNTPDPPADDADDRRHRRRRLGGRGIEAEAAMLGQPITMKLPEVVGVRLTGELPEGCLFYTSPSPRD